MKNIKLFEEFIDESVADDNILKKLYNGIKNDYSIQRNTMTWKDVITALDKKFKNVAETDDQFENSSVTDAIKVATGKLKDVIEGFAKELGIAKQTMSDKDKHPERR